MKHCPLELKIPRCESCMYGTQNLECLYNLKLSVGDFAISKGVSRFSVDAEVRKAENRIQAALVLMDYVAWSRDEVIPVAPQRLCDLELALTTPYCDLGITAQEIRFLAKPENWARFVASKREVTYPLHEVLLVSEWQLEELSQK